MENNNQNSFALRRSLRPYWGLVIVASLFTLYGLYYTFSSHDLFGLCVLFGWVFVVFNMWFGMRYRIWWDDGEIIQRAVAGNLTKIKINEITDVIQETSDLQTLVTLSRPMRRMVIYAKHVEGGKFIDISLKHFLAEDIQRLLNEIQEARPDLTVPTINWSSYPTKN